MCTKSRPSRPQTTKCSVPWRAGLTWSDRPPPRFEGRARCETPLRLGHQLQHPRKARQRKGWAQRFSARLGARRRRQVGAGANSSLTCIARRHHAFAAYTRNRARPHRVLRHALHADAEDRPTRGRSCECPCRLTGCSALPQMLCLDQQPPRAAGRTGCTAALHWGSASRLWLLLSGSAARSGASFPA